MSIWEYHLLSSQDVRRASVFSVRDRAERATPAIYSPASMAP